MTNAKAKILCVDDDPHLLDINSTILQLAGHQVLEAFTGHGKHDVKKISLQQNLCQNFCAYFKPDKKGDLACMGFLVIGKLLKKGKNIPFHTIKKKPDPLTEEKLIKTMCIACPFYENDCDFIQQKEKSLPCGGFMLLGYLLGKNIISIDDIQNII